MTVSIVGTFRLRIANRELRIGATDPGFTGNADNFILNAILTAASRGVNALYADLLALARATPPRFKLFSLIKNAQPPPAVSWWNFSKCQ
jgi:hypothetical protein